MTDEETTQINLKIPTQLLDSVRAECEVRDLGQSVLLIKCIRYGLEQLKPIS